MSTRHGARVEVRGQCEGVGSRLSPRGSPRVNSDHQACREARLLAEPSHLSGIVEPVPPFSPSPAVGFAARGSLACGGDDFFHLFLVPRKGS